MSFIPYDVVIKGGRVMDPENNFDAIRNVGISKGKIIAITEDNVQVRASNAINCVGENPS